MQYADSRPSFETAAVRPPQDEVGAGFTARNLPDGQINCVSTKSKSSIPAKNILIFRNCKSVYIHGYPALTRGALRGRHGRWVRDAVDADGAADESTLSGRRSRVVLTPRRWCQASRKYPRGDGGKRARSPGRARNKPLKPLRGESRMFPVNSW